MQNHTEEAKPCEKETLLKTLLTQRKKGCQAAGPLTIIPASKSNLMLKSGGKEARGEKYVLNSNQGTSKKESLHSTSCDKTVPTDIQLHSPPRTRVLLHAAE
jgi:hypothetical protein